MVNVVQTGVDLDQLVMSAMRNASRDEADKDLRDDIFEFLHRLFMIRLPRERVGAKLEVHDLARRPFPAFHVKRCSGAHRRPQPSTLLARLWIVDPAIHPFGVEP